MIDSVYVNHYNVERNMKTKRKARTRRSPQNTAEVSAALAAGERVGALAQIMAMPTPTSDDPAPTRAELTRALTTARAHHLKAARDYSSAILMQNDEITRYAENNLEAASENLQIAKSLLRTFTDITTKGKQHHG